MTQDEVAMILGWNRGIEADVIERDIALGVQHSQADDGIPRSLWVRADKRSYPTDWLYVSDALHLDEFAQHLRLSNDLIVENETAARVSEETVSFYRSLMGDQHDFAIREFRRRDNDG